MYRPVSQKKIAKNMFMGEIKRSSRLESGERDMKTIPSCFDKTQKNLKSEFISVTVVVASHVVVIV
jgi:hypothetical protein